MQVKLVVVGGDAKAAVIRLKLPAIVGRGRNASLTLPHPLVSRQHCEIVESDGKLLVRDLGSLNGTFVGRERITEAELPPGELLTVGTVTFRAVYDEPASNDPGANGKGNVSGRSGAAAPNVSAGPVETLDFAPADEPQEPDSDRTEPVANETVPDSSGEAGMLDDPEAASDSDESSDFGQSEGRATFAADSGEDVAVLHDDSSDDFHLGEAPDDEFDEDLDDEDPADVDAVEVADVDVESFEDTVEAFDDTAEVEAFGDAFDDEDLDETPAAASDDSPFAGMTFDAADAPSVNPLGEAVANTGDQAEPEQANDADDDLQSFLKGLQ